MSQIAVVIPTFNRPDYLQRLLLSLKSQRFNDMEVVVVDDNSPNQYQYEEVVEQFSEHLKMTYVRNSSNRGAQFSRNRGIALSDSKYVAFVDDDDEWLPGKVVKQVMLLENRPKDIGLVYSWADTMDDSGTVIHRYRASFRGSDLRVLLKSCFMPSPTIMVRREVLEHISFDEEQPSCQDWDMWTRIVEAGYGYDVVEETLAIYHKHHRPSIGQSPRVLEGFYRYYTRHAPYYVELGMMMDLSEKFRGLANQMTIAGMHNQAHQCLEWCVHLYPLNWKGWIKVLQARVRL